MPLQVSVDRHTSYIYRGGCFCENTFAIDGTVPHIRLKITSLYCYFKASVYFDLKKMIYFLLEFYFMKMAYNIGYSNTFLPGKDIDMNTASLIGRCGVVFTW